MRRGKLFPPYDAHFQQEKQKEAGGVGEELRRWNYVWISKKEEM
jgi:hypothetical protein